MSNLATAVSRAQSVNGEKAAARLYLDLESEVSLGAGHSEADYDQADEALDVLRERFPGIRKRADAMAEEHVPNLSRKAKQELPENVFQVRVPLEARPRGEHQAARPRGARARVSHATAIHARPPYGTRASRVTRMAYNQTGAAGAVRSTSQLLMQTGGIIAGMALLYALVGPNGSRAVAGLGNGLVHAMNALFSPTTDPLRPKSTGGRPGQLLSIGGGTFTQPRPGAAAPSLGTVKAPAVGGIGHRTTP